MKFEVGKKYRPDCWRTDTASSVKYFTCIGHFLDGKAIFQSDVGAIFQEHTYESGSIQEYKEPVVHTRYVHWLQSLQDGRIFTETYHHQNHAKSYSSYTLLRVDTVTYTENSNPNGKD